MSETCTEVPDTDVEKNDTFFINWSLKKKIGVFLIILAIYAYVLICLKLLYLKFQRLDRIEALADDIDKLMNHVYAFDEKIAVQIEELDTYMEDY